MNPPARGEKIRVFCSACQTFISEGCRFPRSMAGRLINPLGQTMSRTSSPKTKRSYSPRHVTVADPASTRRISLNLCTKLLVNPNYAEKASNEPFRLFPLRYNTPVFATPSGMCRTLFCINFATSLTRRMFRMNFPSRISDEVRKHDRAERR